MGAHLAERLLGLELALDFLSDFPGLLNSADLEANGSYAGMSTPAVPFADSSQIVQRRFRYPGVGPHRYLGAKGGRADRNRVSRSGK